MAEAEEEAKKSGSGSGWGQAVRSEKVGEVARDVGVVSGSCRCVDVEPAVEVDNEEVGEVGRGSKSIGGGRAVKAGVVVSRAGGGEPQLRTKEIIVLQKVSRSVYQVPGAWYMIRHPRGSYVAYPLLSLEAVTPENISSISTPSSICKKRVLTSGS